jgi:hypothetical protein
VIFFTLYVPLYAQSTDTLRLKYTNFTIYRFGGSFLKGNEKLAFRDLAMEFSNSDLGLISYEQAVKYRRVNKILSGLSVISNLAMLSIIANRGNRNIAFGLATLQFGFILTARKYQSLSNRSIDRALWQRNMDVLYPGPQ